LRFIRALASRLGRRKGPSTVRSASALRFLVGRAFQFAGLVLVGLGFLVGLLKGDLKYEERMLFAGVPVFAVGWLLVRPFKRD